MPPALGGNPLLAWLAIVGGVAVVIAGMIGFLGPVAHQAVAYLPGWARLIVELGVGGLVIWLVAREQLPVAEGGLALAREGLRLVEARFEHGAATQLEVLDGRQVLQGAEIAVLQARLDVQIRAAELLLAAGELRGAVPE